MSTGFQDECDVLLEKFRWGKSFLTVNDQLFSMYSKCTNSADVVAVQQRYLDDVQKQRANKHVDYKGLLKSYSYYNLVLCRCPIQSKNIVCKHTGMSCNGLMEVVFLSV